MYSVSENMKQHINQHYEFHVWTIFPFVSFCHLYLFLNSTWCIFWQSIFFSSVKVTKDRKCLPFYLASFSILYGTLFAGKPLFPSHNLSINFILIATCFRFLPFSYRAQKHSTQPGRANVKVFLCSISFVCFWLNYSMISTDQIFQLLPLICYHPLPPVAFVW